MKRPRTTAAPRAVRLFAEPDRRPDDSQGAYIANIDGAARGNPGPGSYGVVIRRPGGEVVSKIKKAIGQSTNNTAEYHALIAALDYAHAHHIAKLRILSDSELLVRQMKARYKVKSPDLRPLHERACKLAHGLAHFCIEHVPREQNREADALANAALDQTASGTVARLFKGGGSAIQEKSSASSDAGYNTRNSQHKPRCIRATYRGGALHPAQPLDLAEGAEVEITLLPARRD